MDDLNKKFAEIVKNQPVTPEKVEEPEKKKKKKAKKEVKKLEGEVDDDF